MKFRRRNKIEAELSMTSLTDVVFILLIFILVTHSIQSEQLLNVFLPKGAKTKEFTEQIKVQVSRDYEVAVGGEIVNWESLDRALLRALSDNPGANVSIAADKELPYSDVMIVVHAVNQLGGKPILALEPAGMKKK